MSWYTNIVPPGIKAILGRSGVPDNLWHHCPACNHMIFHTDLIKNLHVCSNCNHHMRWPVKERLTHLFDGGVYTEVPLTYKGSDDPLGFSDSKRYVDRLREARHKSGRKDALIATEGKIRGIDTVVAALDFDFMGGSMGQAVGAGFVAAAQHAVQHKKPFVVIVASGGARMQEGILSLMQMPRTTAAIHLLRAARLPYIVVMTDPTTGGVSASFAMLGDVAIAEPGAMIGFAGPRVIEETMRQKLPEGFQKAEYLLDHGMLDMVVNRKDLPTRLGNILGLL